MGGIQGLPSTLRQVLFSAGLDQKSDARESNPPTLDICQNVEFDDVGTLRTRKPFNRTAFTMLDTNGAAVGPVRRVVSDDAEFVLFTDTAVYSWVPEAARWSKRDTHLAVTVDEQTVFGANGDQSNVERAELGGVALFAWIQNGQPFLAARDATTGAVIMSATGADTTGHGADTIRLVTLNTRVLLIWRDTAVAKVKGISINPASVAASIVLATDIALGTVQHLDALQIPGADTALVATGETSTQYRIFKVTSAMAITSRTVARGANNGIAIAIDPAVGVIQVIRSSSTAAANIVGDRLILTTLLDAATNQAIGTVAVSLTSYHITCAYRSVGAPSRCYAFWTDSETTGGVNVGVTSLTAFGLHSNWVDTAGTIGVQNTLVQDLGLASRAFDYNGSVYFWAVFGSGAPPRSTFSGAQLQNTFFLYRDDGLLVAKVCDGEAGGLVLADANTNQPRALPAVQLLSGSTGFKIGLTARRLVPLVVNPAIAPSYSGRTPVEVTFTFDDNRARRCVRFGKTLYVAGGQILQYDGVSLTELGFHIYPWDSIASNVNAGGLLDTGKYTFKTTYKSTNAVGEVDRSTTTTFTSTTTTSATSKATILTKPLYVTRKSGVNLEEWRTGVNPKDESPFNLISSLDPTFLAGDNIYLPNDPTVVLLTETDVLSDFAASQNQANGENGAVLPNINPPPANVIAANDTRIFLGDIAGFPNLVMYSKTRADGEVAAFNDALTVQVPAEGGAITAISFIDRALIVCRETAIYAFGGDGYDNLGQGANYELVRIVSRDCGVPYQEAVAVLDDTLMFRSNKGWYELDPTFTLHYVGAPVSSFDSDDIYSIAVMSSSHQIRIVTDRRIILRDTLVNQWGEWTEFALGAVIWNGMYAIFDVAGVYPQRADFVGITYGWDIEFAWQKANDMQGRGLVRRIKLLGEYRGPHEVRVRLANNYKTDGAGGWLYVSDRVWPVTPTVLGGPEECIVAPQYKRCEAIKVRLTAVALDGVSAPVGDTAKLIGIAFEIAPEEGLYQALSAAQRS